jgi:hypothetical protein
METTKNILSEEQTKSSDFFRVGLVFVCLMDELYISRGYCQTLFVVFLICVD